MVAYSDLVGFAIPAFLMQCLALYYAIQIRKFFQMKVPIANYWWLVRVKAKISWLINTINLIEVVNAAVIVFLLAVSAGRPGQQPIEIWGITFGFVLPTTGALCHMILYHALKVGLFASREDNPAPHATEEERK